MKSKAPVCEHRALLALHPQESMEGKKIIQEEHSCPTCHLTVTVSFWFLRGENEGWKVIVKERNARRNAA